jgi:hypothetical protein
MVDLRFLKKVPLNDTEALIAFSIFEGHQR